jgi:hypothetical protein
MLTITHDGPGTLTLDGEATINFARELHDALAAAVPGLAGPFVIEAGRLEALDLVGAQILLSFRASFAPGLVRFTGWPAAIADFLKTAGLTPHFA